MNELIRLVWRILYAGTVKWMPQNLWISPLRAVRAFFARRICASAGKEINVERGAIFSTKVTLGDRSGIGLNCELHGEVHIGNDVMMAPECIFYTVGHQTSRIDIPMRLQGETSLQPIYVGNDVWFGRRVMVMPGAHIGDGCVIGAGAVVTGEIPPYSIACGVPARVIKYRN